MNPYAKKNLLLRLKNGKSVLVGLEWSKVYNVREETETCVGLSRKFPFVYFYKRPYVKFRYRTEYETMNSIADKSFAVDCTLGAFAKAFGIDYTALSQNGQ